MILKGLDAFDMHREMRKEAFKAFADGEEREKKRLKDEIAALKQQLEQKDDDPLKQWANVVLLPEDDHRDYDEEMPQPVEGKAGYWFIRVMIGHNLHPDKARIFRVNEKATCLELVGAAALVCRNMPGYMPRELVVESEKPVVCRVLRLLTDKFLWSLDEANVFGAKTRILLHFWD